jgi:ubiquinone/menaquinone biosynthesis C-methylase UbiE
MPAEDTIKRSVLDMYLSHPFPQWTRKVRHEQLVGEICRYEFMGLADTMKGARFLDVGCGTANRSMPVAAHFEVGEYVGFDHSTASLGVAEQVAREEEFDHFTPAEGDLFALPFPDDHFDVVVSWGVLHHTSDPLRGFKEMVRVCKPGGYIGIFLYNVFNHWRHNLQKDKVSRLAGEDVEERFAVAHRLYGTKPAGEMTPEEVAYFYDKYCHPHKSDHSIGETLRWFDDHDLQYWGSYTPLGFLDFVRFLQFRADLVEQYPPGGALDRALLSLMGSLPRLPRRKPPFRRPSAFHRFFWQALWAWQGRGGRYSQGAALSARKPIAG